MGFFADLVLKNRMLNFNSVNINRNLKFSENFTKSRLYCYIKAQFSHENVWKNAFEN